MSVRFLPSLGVSNTEPVAEDLSNGLQWHALTLGEEEDDEYPTEKANTCVESEGTTGCPAFHHGQKSGSDYDVSAPASNGILFL